MPPTIEKIHMTCRNLILILGDQLNLDNPALEGFDVAQDKILMVEASAEATHVWSHKAHLSIPGKFPTCNRN